MGNFLIHATLSNVLMSAILALIAWIVQRRFRSATLANLLWCLVLVKMVTPPLLAIPVLEMPALEAPRHSTHSVFVESSTSIVQPTVASETLASHSLLAASLVWLAVSISLFVASSVRIIRFHWLLRQNSVVDHQLTATYSSKVARQLGLNRVPKVIVTSANIAPFVWWMAGRAAIVVSARAINELSEHDIRLVITHEMAHIKRRDHWFRWLEWVTLVVFWWNPVIWWARRQLRISEEMACDELVLQQPHSEVIQYANSLLNVAELLVSSTSHPPILASAINSGGNLEERLKAMMTRKLRTVPNVLRLAIVAIAAGVLPLGFIYAQNDDATEQSTEQALHEYYDAAQQPIAERTQDDYYEEAQQETDTEGDAMSEYYEDAMSEYYEDAQEKLE